ncbi:MAG: exo-alpha-sialidase [Lentisphaeria bacterium]|nr:exo-alpha-sialidase [Lentisphaeria bacterium]
MADTLWIHPVCTKLTTSCMGPFAHLPNGDIVGFEGVKGTRSCDGGRTWEPWGTPPPRTYGEFKPGGETALLCTREGTLVRVFSNLNEANLEWDSATHRASENTRLPVYATRSEDGGKTWLAPVKLQESWCGAIRDMIQTCEGRIVVTSQVLTAGNSRHATLTYSSDDDGRTWEAGNLIDLGGRGNHGGCCESAVEELRDGRFWLLIRTNLGQFWSAFSDDGRYWRTMQPSGIEASSAPAGLKRLSDGRLVMLWNRPGPEDGREWPLTGGDMEWSEYPVSNFREELSLAISGDDGSTWSAPVVVARKADAWLSYPYLYEPEPGTLWVTTMQGGVRMAVDVARVER